MVSLNTYQRIATGCIMVGGLALTAISGAYGLIAMVFMITCKVFQELRRLALADHDDGSMTKMMDWLLFGICSFWVSSESIWNPRRLLCIMLYTLWFMMSVSLLQPIHVQQQLVHFGWIHLCVLFTAVQMYFVISNITHGVAWFVFPSLLVVCNDVAAYGCGRLVGRTPLFRLSPNKTVEGFVGAAILTVAFGFLVIFVFQCIQFTLKISKKLARTMMKDDPYGGVVLALYASCAAPFGGFLASAIKRATGIKDFGQWIPGHGGMTDRMDCQLLMNVFTFAYRHQLFLS